MIEARGRVGVVPRVPGGAAAIIVAAAVLGVLAGLLLHLLTAGGSARGGAAAGAAQPAQATGRLAGQATWAAGSRPAPAIVGLRDQAGSSFSLSSLRGHTVAVTFLDSHCTQACPLEGRALGAAISSLPVRERPVLLVVSVNPLDSPRSARTAVRRWGMARGVAWHWLMGSTAELRRVWGAYHVLVAPGRGDIVHTELLYLLDRHGDERSGYLYPFLPRSVAHDATVLAGEARRD